MSSPPSPARLYFIVSLSYLVVVLALGLAYFWSPALKTWLPANLGPIPLGVPWWGALGAVVVSLYGIFFHNADWDPSFDYWHIARPLLGATLGMVAFLIMVVVIQSTGSRANLHGNLAYYLAAFLVGFSEATFQGLINRATQVLFTSASQTTKPGAKPSEHN